jgi:hypothetical protein
MSTKIANSILTDHHAGVFQEGYHAGLFGTEATGILAPEDVDVFYNALIEGQVNRTRMSSELSSVASN